MTAAPTRGPSVISAPAASNNGSATGKIEENETDRVSSESRCDKYSNYISTAEFSLISRSS